MSQARVHIFIHGLVQGVNFRYYTFQKANQLNLTGWASNTSDNRVEAVFEGEKEKIIQILEWIKESPGNTQVNKVDIEWQKPANEFNEFEIRYF